MKNKSLYFFVVILLLCVSGNLSAQSNFAAVRQSLNHMFSGLDMSRVPYGILRDYAIDYADWDKYSGTSVDGSAVVNLPALMEIIQTINSASVDGRIVVDLDADMNIVESVQSAGSVAVGIVAYKYSYIRADAISGGYLTFSSDVVRDVYSSSNEWRNPYQEGVIVAFSPFKSIVDVRNVTYDLSSFTYSNFNFSVEFDADDGLGFRSVGSSGIIHANYLDCGIKNLVIRIISGDEVYLSKSLIYVDIPQPSLLGDADVDSLMVFTDSIFCSVPYLGDTPSALVSTKLAPTHSRLERPFVVVEGFDPLGLTGLSSKRFGSTNISTVYCDLPDVIKDNYDIVYVDWNNSEAYIQANANLLIQILDMVNSSKANPTDPIILMGQSMGGLISRCALCMMEQDSHPHYVSTFISDDVPYLGVNVPIGVQYAFQDIKRLLEEFEMGPEEIQSTLLRNLGVEGIDINSIWEILDWHSSRQMLANYVSPSGLIDNSMHDSFMDHLILLGFPSGDAGRPIVRYAITNGGENSWTDDHILGKIQGTVFPEGRIKIIECILPFLLTPGLLGQLFMSGGSSVEVDMNIYPYTSFEQTVYDCRITLVKKFLWCIEKSFNIYNNQGVVHGTRLPFDSHNGSSYSVESLLAEGALAENESKLLYLNGEYCYSDNQHRPLANIPVNMWLAKQVMFVPTPSSLCIGSGNRSLQLSDYLADYSNPSSYLDQTPFHSIFIGETASYHIDLGVNGLSAWLTSILSQSIYGPSVALHDTQYVVSGNASSVHWSTSDSSIATIASDGTLSIVSPGEVTIIATLGSGPDQVILTKTIWAGFPSCSLSAITSNVLPSVRVRVSFPSAFQPYLEDSGISFQWGVKYGRRPTTWEDSSSTHFDCERSESSEMTVFFRMVRGNDVGNSISESFAPFFGHHWGDDPVIMPFCIGSNGEILCDESTRPDDTETKAIQSSQLIYTIGDEIVIHSNEILSPSSLCELLVAEPRFMEMVSDMMPWGDQTMKLIKISIKDTTFEFTVESLMKFVYLGDVL